MHYKTKPKWLMTKDAIMRNELIITLLYLFFYTNSYSQIIDTIPIGGKNTEKSGEIQLAKEDCEINLRKALDAYNLGDFDKVIFSISPCIAQKKFDNETMLDALVLLASTYCADDEYMQAKKCVNEILTIEPDFRVRTNDLIQFKIIFEEEKRRRAGAQVSSVSKFSESLYEAPATVMLVTEEEIKQRGYMDLEELLHDLPGFDISRSNGITYSHIYQRGYRVATNNRILLVIDGIEENDLWGNILYLSRQYPLSNIKSIEVVYGPVSTVYGPNGFLGVISINTKKPDEFLPKSDNISVNIEAGNGQWNTRYIDGTIAVNYPKQDIDLSITYRHFNSDGANFENIDEWHDYQPWSLDDSYELDNSVNTIRDLYRDKLTITDSDSIQTFLSKYQSNNDYFIDTLINGTQAIVPTEKGIRQALLEDNAATSGQDTISVRDYTMTDMISMRFRFKNVYAGFHRWTKREGLGLWFSDYQHSSDERWSPKVTAAFVKYEQQLNKNFFISSFARYKLHSFDDNNNYLKQLSGFRNGKLLLGDLIDGKLPDYSSTYYSTHSNQIRLENRLYYTLNLYQTLMVGIENRLSSIQDNYYTSPTPNPEAHPDNDVSHYFSNDMGIYAQYSQKMKQFSKKLKDLSFTTGIRWDFNEVHGETRIKPLPTFRGVVIFTPKDYVFKFLYSSAFKTPTNQDFYSTVEGVRDIVPFELVPESVHSFEISGRRFLDKYKTTSVQFTAFHSRYSHAIETATFNGVFNDISNPKYLTSRGERIIEGAEGTIDYRYQINKDHKFKLYGNYSFIYPRSIDSATQKVELIGDMSRHKFNTGINYNYKRLVNVNLRMNFRSKSINGTIIDDSDTLFTTVDNIYANNNETFGATAILHGAITYNISKYGISIQAVANNLLNTKYFSPGIRSADGVSFSARLPQNPRAFHLKVRFNMSYSTRHLQEDQLIGHKD